MMRFRVCPIALVLLGFAFLDAFSVRANETFPTPPEESACIQQNLIHNLFFTEIERHQKSQELARLRGKKFSDYFGKSVKEVVNGADHAILRSQYTAEDVKRFENDWDRLLDLSHDFGLIDSDHVREGLMMKYGKPYPLITPSNIETVYKGPKGDAFTLSDLQSQFSIEYTDFKELQHGEFSGWRKHLSPSSPYSVTYKAIRKSQAVWAATGKYILLGLGLGFSGPLIKPIIAPYTAGVDTLASKALDYVVPQRREQALASRELDLMIQKKGQLIREAGALDFAKMPTKAERLKQWAELERRLKENQNQINDQRSKIKIPSKMENIDKPVSPFEIQNRRTDLLTSLSSLAKDKSTLGETAKIETLATLKAVELLDTGSNTAGDAAEKVINRMVDQLASDPNKFQTFVRQYLAAQWTPPLEDSHM